MALTVIYAQQYTGADGRHVQGRILHFSGVLHAKAPLPCLQAGLVLALLGGVRKNVAARDCVPIRGDIHVLVCGDPGLGKSQLLRACTLPHTVLLSTRGGPLSSSVFLKLRLWLCAPHVLFAES